MNTAVVIPNINKDANLCVTKKVIEVLSSSGINVYIEDRYAELFRSAVGYSAFPKKTDIIIVVGGDGTVIDASKYAIEYNIPILCVNLGKVGYLSEIEPDMLHLLGGLKSNRYTVNEKMMLEFSGVGFDGVASKYAVNDVVISHESYLGIADIKLEDGVGNSIKYRADGIILSTPQGSTAYSLSAGGPIVAHDVESIIVTPVCAHSFFDRSVIFNSSEIIKITNISDIDLNISVDGRYAASLMSGASCYVKKANCKLKMVSFGRNGMFSNLFKKMKMLEDTE